MSEPTALPAPPLQSSPRVRPSAKASRSLLGAGAVLSICVVLSTAYGTLTITPSVLLAALVKGLTGRAHELDGLGAIVWNIRLPRVTMGVLVGMSLGASGAATQGLLRNPLADPYLMGTASGASFGATLAMMVSGGLALPFAPGLFAHGAATLLVPPFAFLGALGAVAFTLTLARSGRASNSASLLLGGVVVGSVLTSLTTFLMLRDADRLRGVFSWTLGNLALAGWPEVTKAAPYVVLGAGVLWLCSSSLDALQLGEDTARTLGVNVERVRRVVVLASSLTTAAAVCFVGLIGFVGLVAPHVMRRLGAPTHRALLPASALAGAALLVLSDLVARTLIRPAELPVGVVTTLLGGPFFLWLLRSRP